MYECRYNLTVVLQLIVSHLYLIKSRFYSITSVWGGPASLSGIPMLTQRAGCCQQCGQLSWSPENQGLLDQMDSCALVSTVSNPGRTVAHSRFSTAHCYSFSSPAMTKPCPWQWEMTVTVRTVWFDLYLHELTTALTLQKDLKMGIYCFDIHLSYITLPKLYELLKMQIRIMVIEWLWLTWKRFDHQYNGA